MAFDAAVLACVSVWSGRLFLGAKMAVSGPQSGTAQVCAAWVVVHREVWHTSLSSLWSFIMQSRGLERVRLWLVGSVGLQLIPIWRLGQHTLGLCGCSLVSGFCIGH